MLITFGYVDVNKYAILLVLSKVTTRNALLIASFAGFIMEDYLVSFFRVQERHFPTSLDNLCSQNKRMTHIRASHTLNRAVPVRGGKKPLKS